MPIMLLVIQPGFALPLLTSSTSCGASACGLTTPALIVNPFDQNSVIGKSSVGGILPASGRPGSFVLGDVDADDTYSTSPSRCGNGIVNDVVLLRIKPLVDALEAAAVTASVDAIGLQLEDLLRGIAFGEIDWNSADFFSFGQANGNVIDHINARGTSEKCGICAEKADRTRTKDSDSLASAKAGKIKTGPGCGPDVTDHKVVELS